MEKMTEVIIRKLLKGWVDHYHPPRDGRARLLWEASRQSRNQPRSSIFNSQKFVDYPVTQSNEWSYTLSLWIMENTQRNGVQARVC